MEMIALEKCVVSVHEKNLLPNYTLLVLGAEVTGCILESYSRN
jgi:hypothetical protein